MPLCRSKDRAANYAVPLNCCFAVSLLTGSSARGPACLHHVTELLSCGGRHTAATASFLSATSTLTFAANPSPASARRRRNLGSCRCGHGAATPPTTSFSSRAGSSASAANYTSESSLEGVYLATNRNRFFQLAN